MSRQLRPLRIAIVTQYYRPEHHTIAALLAERLTARGHAVRVLTGFPNYPEGRVFDGYKQRWRQREIINGVDVLRVPMYMDHSRKAAKRMANYLSFGASTTLAGSWVRSADVVYVYASQMTSVFGPELWRMTRRTPYVLHVQDLWPDSITGSGIVQAGRVNRAIDRVVHFWLRGVYRRASGVIAIAPSMAKTLRERGAGADKTHIVLNWTDESLVTPDAVEPIRFRDDARGTVNAVYAGNLGDMQDLETVIRAAARLLDESRFRLRIIGSGVAENRLRALCKSLNARNVDFVGPVLQVDMPAVYAASEFQVVSLKGTEALSGTVPSKLQASLAFGVPVIVCADGDASAIVAAAGTGFTAPAGDVLALERAFREAVALPVEEQKRMAARARHVYESTMSEASGVAAIEEILKNAAMSVEK